MARQNNAPEPTVRVSLRRSFAYSRGPYAGQSYGPGEVDVPIGFAKLAGLEAVDATAQGENGDGGELEGVSFASSAARDAAIEAGLTADSFARRRKSSDNGFTKADVERIAEANAPADGESVEEEEDPNA